MVLPSTLLEWTRTARVTFWKQGFVCPPRDAVGGHQALGSCRNRARYLSRKLAPKTEDDDRPSLPEIKKGDQPDYLPDPIHAELKERICDLQTRGRRSGITARRRAPPGPVLGRHSRR